MLAGRYGDKQTADDGDRKAIGPARAAQAVADAERFLAAVEAALAGWAASLPLLAPVQRDPRRHDRVG